MTHRLLAALAVLFLVSCIGDDEPSATRETTPNGLAFILLHLDTDIDVSIQAAWPTDWGYRPDTNKAAPFVGTQLILAGGAEGYPAGEVGEQFADLNSEGIIYSAVSDHIIGELTFEIEHMEETVAAANAHLRAPTLEQVWFDRVRDDLATKMAETQSQPGPAGFDASRWAIFGDAPLRNALSLDAPGTFESLSRDDIAAWHAETFTQAPTAIVVAGDISAETSSAMSRSTLQDGGYCCTYQMPKRRRCRSSRFFRRHGTAKRWRISSSRRRLADLIKVPCSRPFAVNCAPVTVLVRAYQTTPVTIVSLS